MIDPGNVRECETAENEYHKGFDAGLADGFDNLPYQAGNETWYDDGYRDGYIDINQE
jgi:hypothetical protein